MKDLPIGIFGKIPAHGDFIERHLPRSFLSPWDEWLQQAISSSKELLADNWLDIYLTSPVWRFVTTAGVIDGNAWAGILVPSVDSVGRYFPLTIVRPITAQCNVFNFLHSNSDWYQSLTDSALGALQTPFNAEQLLTSLNESKKMALIEPITPTMQGLAQQAIVGFYQNDISESYSHMLYDHWIARSPAFSLWSCSGSQRMPPSSFAVSGLPSGKQFCALLDGNWNQWGG